MCPFFFMHREAGEPPPEETRRLGTNVLGRGARVSPAARRQRRRTSTKCEVGDPFRGVGGALLSPPRRNTTKFAASDRALSDVCFYVAFSQKVLRYFLGALKCLVPFLFYASGSRRTIAKAGSFPIVIRKCDKLFVRHFYKLLCRCTQNIL